MTHPASLETLENSNIEDDLTVEIIRNENTMNKMDQKEQKKQKNQKQQKILLDHMNSNDIIDTNLLNSNENNIIMNEHNILKQEIDNRNKIHDQTHAREEDSEESHKDLINSIINLDQLNSSIQDSLLEKIQIQPENSNPSPNEDEYQPNFGLSLLDSQEEDEIQKEHLYENVVHTDEIKIDIEHEETQNSQKNYDDKNTSEKKLRLERESSGHLKNRKISKGRPEETFSNDFYHSEDNLRSSHVYNDSQNDKLNTKVIQSDIHPTSSNDYDEQVEKVTLRTVLTPQDVKQLQKVHSELFPVPYNKNFFENLVRHPKIYTCVATTIINNEEKIIGVCSCRVQEVRKYDWINGIADNVNFIALFLCCCLIPFFVFNKKTQNNNSTYHQSNKYEKLPSEQETNRRRQPSENLYHIRTGYIMTLGVTKNYRRRGLASEMLKIVLNKMKSYFHCHQLMLHCKTDNSGALEFYKKVFGFKIYKKIPSYYNIDNVLEDAYELVLKLDNGPIKPPPRTATANTINKVVSFFDFKNQDL